MGTLSMVNKSQPSDAFAESDELLAMVLCDQVSNLLTQCWVHEHSLSAANVYRRTIESAVTLCNIIPDRETVVADREFTPGQLISQIEEIAQNCLKCTVHEARRSDLKHLDRSTPKSSSLWLSQAFAILLCR